MSRRTGAVQERDGTDEAEGPAPPDLNEVRLAGRVSGDARAATLPSGDEVVTFRLVVRRPAGSTPEGGPSVDTLDVACWSGRARQRGRPLADGDRVEVVGSLRRRFFRTGAGPASRYEVAADSIRRQR